MVHLVSSRTNYSATQLPELMFEQIYKLMVTQTLSE